MDSVRLDKWLWAVRLYKNRGEATKACGRNEVQVEGQVAKASRNIAVGMTITVQLKDYERRFQVTQLAQKPVGNDKGHLYYEDVSDSSVKEALQKDAEAKEYQKTQTPPNKKSSYAMPKRSQKYTKDRKGRPSKKERRDMEGMWDL